MCRLSLVACALATLIAGCGSSIPPDVASARGDHAPDIIIAWGDSLTSGDFASSIETTYPQQLARILGRPVVNAGVSGQTSREIAARQGGAPALVTLDHDEIPEAGAARIASASAAPINVNGPLTLAGTLAGVRGFVVLDAVNHLQFARIGTGAAVHVAPGTAFHPDTEGTRDFVTLLWMGRNNHDEPDQVLADVAACVAYLQTDRYAVLAVTNGANEGRLSPAYDDIISINDRLAQAYPGHYVDVRGALVDSFDPLNLQDELDHLQDTVPSSLRADDIHLNDAGYLVVAQTVARFLADRGW